MFPLDSPPRKSAKMRRRPSVQIDVEQANSAPAPRRWPTAGRTHTAYTDFVTTLRRKGEATEALVHYQQTGKYLGQGLGVEERKKDKQKLAEPRTHEPDADLDDYSNMFEQDLSGELNNTTMGGYVSEQNKLVRQVHASDEPTPFFKIIIERYPYPGEIIKERTDDDFKALFDDLPSPKKSPKN